jgi:DMSO/TMAO reductase YedYZ molybdopterin-dependent catalytic subunit
VSELRSDFEPVEVAAVCQCSGNRRGFSEPHVTGVQWGLGAVGNALWKGARLKDVLKRVDLRPDTIEIAFNGADIPVADGTPDFIKSLPLEKAPWILEPSATELYVNRICTSLPSSLRIA